MTTMGGVANGLPTLIQHTMGSGVPNLPSLKSTADSVYSSRHPKEDAMDTTTLLIIIVVLLLLGGGWYGRGRWY